jgi:uncharacterized membrane protein YgdD (TMEM256/DUF423 family)
VNVRLAFLLAAVFGASAVALGAYAAHGMEKRLIASDVQEDVIQHRVENAQIAVRYQLSHTVAMLVLASFSASGYSRCLGIAQWLFVAGMIFFCGGLSLFAMTGEIGHWAIIPAGGLSLILGWCFLAVHAIFCWPFDAPATPG